MTVTRIHWIRHGHIASHEGDVPLTEEGVSQAQKRGRVLAGDLSPGEVVHFMHAPTLRTRQTAQEVRKGMRDALKAGFDVDLTDLREQPAIRNPDLFVAGQRVEMVSNADALSEQLTTPPVDPATLSEHPFFAAFWASPDRIGYWMGHRDPPGEDPVAVGRRQMAFALSLPEAGGGTPARYVLSTHSPVLRAILLTFLDEEPGEPEHLESVDLTIREGAPELGFRELRKRLPDSRVVKATRNIPFAT